MAIMRWDPFGEMLRMQRDMDRIFSRMGEGERSGGQTSGVAWMPKINVKQSGDDIAMHVELAGIKPEDVDIEVTDGVLTIRGERKSEEERENEGWLVRESSYGSFERSMVLPEGVDPASIQADFHDGMLEVHVPKALEAAKPKTTKVAIGGVQAGSQQQRPAMAEQGTETTQGEEASQGGQSQEPMPQAKMPGDEQTQSQSGMHH